MCVNGDGQNGLHTYFVHQCPLKKIKSAAHKNGDVDGTCKHSPIPSRTFKKTSLLNIFTVRQGNVFTPVCDSVDGGGSVPACTTGHMTGGSLSKGSERPPPRSNERAVRILLECILVH